MVQDSVVLCLAIAIVRGDLRIFMHPLYNQIVPHDYEFAILELDKVPCLSGTAEWLRR